MATESVVSPVMLNRPITDARGCLTQYGYSLFSRLLDRTGGTVGSVVDVPSLEESIGDAMSLAETAATAPAAVPVIPQQNVDTLVYSLAAEVAALRVMVEGLQKGYQI